MRSAQELGEALRGLDTVVLRDQGNEDQEGRLTTMPENRKAVSIWCLSCEVKRENSFIKGR